MMTTTPTDKSDKEIPEYCQVLQFKDSNGQVKEMLFPKGLDLDRPKRPRTTFSESQLSVLETEFTRNQYLVGKDRTRLAKELKLSETQIKVWFQNRRTKSKRDKPSGKSPELSQMKSPSAHNAATAHSDHSGFTDITSVAPLLSPVEFTSATQQQLHTSTMLNAYGKLLASVMTTPYPGLSYMPNFPIANFNYVSSTPNFKSDSGSDGQT